MEFEVKDEWIYYVNGYEPYHNACNVEDRTLFGKTLEEVAKKASKLIEADIISKAYKNKIKRRVGNDETPLNKKSIKNLINNHYYPANCEIGKVKTIEYKGRKIILEEDVPLENVSDYECMNYIDLDKTAEKILKLLVKDRKNKVKKMERELKLAKKEIEKVKI